MLRTLSFFLLFAGVVVGKYNLPQEWVDDIHSNKDAVRQIVNYIRGTGKHRAYNRLANFTDKFGHRIIGSKVLEDSIDYAIEQMGSEGYDNVHGEDITAPKWVRGTEYAEMRRPRVQKMSILAFGSSVATDPEGFEAEAIVVHSFDELEQMKDQVRDKIVIFNQEWKGYGDTVRYRYDAAWRSSVHGAKAAMVRSMTHWSVYTPHTGIQTYNTTYNQIPSIAITVEDAEMFDRMQARGENIRIFLQSNASNEGNITSRNVVADITGKVNPEELVIFGGHIDSWDVGTGAMDDAGGCVISWEALATIKALGLQPRRTMRAVLWTAEEIGLVGSNQFYDRHKANQGNISVVMESDSGTFRPLGIGFSGSSLARGILDEILSLLEEHSINYTRVGPSGSAPDISIWHNRDNVPIGSFDNDNGDYFIYHHTDADTMTVENPDALDEGTILWTVATYVIANLKEKLPREGTAATIPPTTATAQLTTRLPSFCTLALAFFVAVSMARRK